MKQLILGIIALCIISLQSCEKEQIHVSEKPLATSESNAKSVLILVTTVGNAYWTHGSQYTNITFNQLTANTYGGTLYMHIKINNVWTYNILPSPWTNPTGRYLLPGLASGTYQIYFSTGQLPTPGSSSPVYNLTV